MKTRTEKVQSIQVHAHCENCGSEMKWDGRELTIYPPLYPHTCIQCGRTENLKRVYPCIEYVKQEG